LENYLIDDFVVPFYLQEDHFEYTELGVRLVITIEN